MTDFIQRLLILVIIIAHFRLNIKDLLQIKYNYNIYISRLYASKMLMSLHYS